MNVSLRELLEAGAHFGHQTNRWNPKMKPFIFEARKGIYIIDLQKTLKQLEQACKAIEDAASQGKYVLLVGTKKQAVEVIRTESEKCGMPYVCERWLGGTLTNMRTVRQSISRLQNIENMEADGSIERFTKKERVHLSRDKMKLLKNLGGIRHMDSLPGIVFVIDPEREKIAIKEAIKLNIPVVALIDTNCDPTLIDYPIPANDDAIKTISLITSKLAEAVMSGVSMISEDTRKQIAKAEKKVEKKPEKKFGRREGPRRERRPVRPEKKKKDPEINRIQIDSEVFSEEVEEKLDKKKESKPVITKKKEQDAVQEVKETVVKKEEKKKTPKAAQATEEKPAEEKKEEKKKTASKAAKPAAKKTTAKKTAAKKEAPAKKKEEKEPAKKTKKAKEE